MNERMNGKYKVAAAGGGDDDEDDDAVAICY